MFGMNSVKDSYCESPKSLQLIGAQVNLTPRSNKTVLAFDNRRTRPCSAVSFCRIKTECQAKDVRPKSADYKNLTPSNGKSLQWSLNFNENNILGGSSLTVSHFTDSSSKLLQNLIKTSEQKTPVEIVPTEDRCCFEQPKNHKMENTIVQKYLNVENDNKFLPTESPNNVSEFQTNSQEDDIWMTKNSNLRYAIAKANTAEVSGDSQGVRFSEKCDFDIQSEKQLSHQVKFAYFKDTEDCFACVKNDIKPLWQETDCNQSWKEKTLGKPKHSDLEVQRTDTDNESKSDKLKSSYSSIEAENLKNIEENKKDIFREECETSPKDIKIFHRTVENLEKIKELPNFQRKERTKSKLKEISAELVHSFDEDKYKKCCKSERNEKDANDGFHKKIDVSDSTYEEIVHLLQTLDEEDSESLSSENKELSTVNAFGSPKENTDYLSAVSSYLEEVERDNSSLHEHQPNTKKWNTVSFASPRLDELLNKESVELAQEVFSLKIQMEDQKKGIKLLKDTLAKIKEVNKVEKLEHQEALHKVTLDAEALVQRHQKFIKQLLNEKKNLNETVSKLVQDLKSGEERYKKNIKTMEEKHLIEIKRAREAQAVADKIKREKWMESKTQKIKEMTVKGLEPELSRMATRQQEEITELRNLHKAELEALELRAARRNSELMDELRAELTKEKERAIAKEIASLRTALEKNFEDEKNKLEQYCQNLKERIRKQEERLSERELEFQQRLMDYRQEEEKKKQKMIREHQENLEEVQRQHLVEIKHLKETAEVEKEVLLNNYKKQQTAKNLEREAELHQQYKRERDKDIELVIETLEKESTQIQSELNAANENKLKRLKDKMEAEIKEIEASEAALKVKLSETKSKLSEKEDFITELSSQIRQLQTELTFVKKLCEEMSLEKAKLKEVIREEFQNSIEGLIREKENLEKDIVALKEHHLKELAKKDQQNFQAKYQMQKELTGVYSRIKTAVSKKERIIESLREENEAANQRCRQLEMMLDQQRRNLLLH